MITIPRVSHLLFRVYPVPDPQLFVVPLSGPSCQEGLICVEDVTDRRDARADRNEVQSADVSEIAIGRYEREPISI